MSTLEEETLRDWLRKLPVGALVRFEIPEEDGSSAVAFVEKRSISSAVAFVEKRSIKKDSWAAKVNPDKLLGSDSWQVEDRMIDLWLERPGCSVTWQNKDELLSQLQALPVTPRLSMCHKLKIAPEHWEKVYWSEKKAEIRLNDRNYQEGDIIQFTDLKGAPLGEDLCWRITHVLSHEDFPEGLQAGYVMLSLSSLRFAEV